MSFNVLKKKEADFKKGLKFAFFQRGWSMAFVEKLTLFLKISFDLN